MSFVQGLINSEVPLNSFCTESKCLFMAQKNRLESRLSSRTVNGRQLYAFENSNFEKEVTHLNKCIKACEKVKALYERIKPQLLEINKASNPSISVPNEEAQKLMKKITFIYNQLPRGADRPFSCKREQVQGIIDSISAIMPRSLVLASQASLRNSLSGPHSLFASLPPSLLSPRSRSTPFNNQSLSSSYFLPSRRNLLENDQPQTTRIPQQNVQPSFAPLQTLQPLQQSVYPFQFTSLTSSVNGLEVPASAFNVQMNRSFPLADGATLSENLQDPESLETPNFAEVIPQESSLENEGFHESRLQPLNLTKEKVSLWKRLFNHTLTPLIGGGSLTLLSFVCLGLSSSVSVLVIPGLLCFSVGIPLFFLGVLWNLLPRPQS